MNPDELKIILDAHRLWLVDAGGERAILREANLSGADLCGAYLSGADLCDANMRGADLCGAYLSGADLRGAYLREANLSGADLCGADLFGADLCEANMRWANLRGADLCEADLCGAALRGAIGIVAVGPGGSRGDMLYAVYHDSACMVKAGCYWGALDNFATAVEARHGSNEHGVYYRAAIEMLRVWYAQQQSTMAKGAE